MALIPDYVERHLLKTLYALILAVIERVTNDISFNVMGDEISIAFSPDAEFLQVDKQVVSASLRRPNSERESLLDEQRRLLAELDIVKGKLACLDKPDRQIK